MQNNQQKTSSEVVIAHYNTKVEPRVLKVITASSNPNDELRGLLINEIHRLRNFRKDLRRKYFDLFNYVSAKSK